MKDEKEQDLKVRTKAFALRIIRLYSNLPKTTESQVMGKQVLRSGTSVGAHYREAYRAKSDADFISKMEGGLQELDETGYWLELLVESEVVQAEKLESLMQETDELTAIFVSIVVKVKNRINQSRKPRNSDKAGG
ncbi:MAG: four helix bundle protein [Anaerolineales bacterium]